MSALVLRKLKKGKFHGFCHNRCKGALAGAVGNRRVASHVAVLLDYETLLCSGCASAWRKIWKGALNTSPEGTAAGIPSAETVVDGAVQLEDAPSGEELPVDADLVPA